MPPDAEARQQTNWYISCALIALFLILGVSIIVSSHSSTDVLIIGIPVFLMLIAVGCILSNLTNRQPVEVTGIIDEEVGLQTNVPSDSNERNPFTDCPPSYRLTWRRSFLKRLKSTSMFSDRSAENTPPITPDPKSQSNYPHTEAAEAMISIDERPSQEPPNISKDQTAVKSKNDDLPTYEEAIEITTPIEN